MEYKLENLKNKSVLITGASSGIGNACAHFLGKEGVKLKLLARREGPLKELNKAYGGEYLVGDINQLETQTQMEEKNFFESDIVINNAGLAIGKDDFYQTNDDDIDLVIQTNINSAFKVAKKCLQSMKRKSIGDIVNICSIASHEAYKGGVVYCASKHALLAMGKAIRKETYGENIRVINVSPGMVETEFSKVRFRGDEKKAKDIYQGMTPLRPEDIAYQIAHALKSPRHVNIDEIIILATDQAGATERAHL